MLDNSGFDDFFDIDPDEDSDSLYRKLQQAIQLGMRLQEKQATIVAELERRNRHGEPIPVAANGRKPHGGRRRRHSDLPPGEFLEKPRFTRDPETGIVTVQIPGHFPLKPPPLLGCLMFVLCDDSLPTDDHLVAWKERKWICRNLSALLKREMRTRNLNQSVYRLREYLDNGAHIGGKFVLVHSSDGRVRLAVRHHPN